MPGTISDPRDRFGKDIRVGDTVYFGVNEEEKNGWNGTVIALPGINDQPEGLSFAASKDCLDNDVFVLRSDSTVWYSRPSSMTRTNERESIPEDLEVLPRKKANLSSFFEGR